MGVQMPLPRPPHVLGNYLLVIACLQIFNVSSCLNICKQFPLSDLRLVKSFTQVLDYNDRRLSHVLLACLPLLSLRSGLHKYSSLCPFNLSALSYWNIARIANAVQCHSILSVNTDCHESRFSMVIIVISVLNVTSHKGCICHYGHNC